MGPRHLRLRQRGLPGHGGRRQRDIGDARAHPVGRHEGGIIVYIAERVAVGMHHQLAQRAGAHERRDAFEQLAGHERHHRAAVLHDVFELVAQQHGVDRHEHRVGPQDREVGRDELRAVLAEHEHAVARRHVARVLQVTGHGFGLGQQFVVAHGLAEELHRGLGRVAAGRGLEVAEQAGLGNVGLAWQAAAGARRVDAQGTDGALGHARGRGARVWGAG
ncbi:hypothetical protein D3C86_1537800 [compost metagenome]